MSRLDPILRRLGRPRRRLEDLLIPAMDPQRRVQVLDAIRALGPREGDRVLDVGFDDGTSFQLLRPRVGVDVPLYGLDPRPESVTKVRRRFSTQVAGGKILMRQASVDRVPWPETFFDGVLSVNDLYWWADLHRGLVEIRRVLRDGGRVVLSATSRHSLEQDQLVQAARRVIGPEHLQASLLRAGFHDPTIHPTGARDWYEVVARR